MLARELGISLPATPPVIPSRIADWCVHRFRYGRKNWLIFCNTASLYSICAGASGVTDGESLARRAGGMIPLVLGKNSFGSQAEKFTAELTEFQWAPIPDRSVLGSMNDLIYMATGYLEDPEILPETLADKLGKTPMSALGMNHPTRVFGTIRS